MEAELKKVEENHETVRKSYKKLLAGNEEMGLELIGLLNAKVDMTSANF